MVIVMLGPSALCPRESRRNGVTLSVPAVAFSGMLMVSCIVIESRSGLENRTESVYTTGPVVCSPSARTLSAVLPLTVTSMDFPRTAELPEVGLMILTSGGGTLPVAMISVSRSEEHTSELQSLAYLVCRLLLEKKNICYSPCPGSLQRSAVRPLPLSGAHIAGLLPVGATRWSGGSRC